MCSGKWIAPIESKRTVSKILNINLCTHGESFPANKVHPSRPPKHIPGFDPASVKIDQISAGECTQFIRIEVGKLKRDAAFKSA